jgi:hypothetical protein
MQRHFSFFFPVLVLWHTDPNPGRTFLYVVVSLANGVAAERQTDQICEFACL